MMWGIPELLNSTNHCADAVVPLSKLCFSTVINAISPSVFNPPYLQSIHRYATEFMVSEDTQLACFRRTARTFSIAK
jgi:hypothetical protein